LTKAVQVIRDMATTLLRNKRSEEAPSTMFSSI